MANRKLFFAISMLNGGGAENQMSNLIAGLRTMGVDASLIVTNQSQKDARFDSRLDNVPMLFVEDHIKNPTCVRWKIWSTSLACHLFEDTRSRVPEGLADCSFRLKYQDHVDVVRNHLKQREPCPIVAFLLPTTQIILKAAEGLPFPVILSERGDPDRYLHTRYASLFFHRYYNPVKAMVFQTPYALQAYPAAVRPKGAVIPNSLRENLPPPHTGRREKVVVNFCRLEPQKNLPLLIDAFLDFHRTHQDYRLEIYGDGPDYQPLSARIRKEKAEAFIQLLPFDPQLHEKIHKYAMFVSSSDHEGLSNSMLEAMAIGLPTICTDCGGGGARFAIRDGETGLLVPMRQAKALSAAMSKVADSEALSKKLSLGGAGIRESLKSSVIARRWYDVIFDEPQGNDWREWSSLS